MSLPQTTDGYGLGPEEGEALWFHGARIVLKATAEQTGGRFAISEWWARKGFAAPLHVHSNDDEFFVVLDGEVRFQLGEDVIEGTAGSLVYGPRSVGHSFRIDSDEARLLLGFAPAGTEGFFRELGRPAGSPGLPPAEAELPDFDSVAKIAEKYAQTFIGPPLPPIS